MVSYCATHHTNKMCPSLEIRVFVVSFEHIHRIKLTWACFCILELSVFIFKINLSCWKNVSQARRRQDWNYWLTLFVISSNLQILTREWFQWHCSTLLSVNIRHRFIGCIRKYRTNLKTIKLLDKAALWYYWIRNTICWTFRPCTNFRMENITRSRRNSDWRQKWGNVLTVL